MRYGTTPPDGDRTVIRHRNITADPSRAVSPGTFGPTRIRSIASTLVLSALWRTGIPIVSWRSRVLCAFRSQGGASNSQQENKLSSSSYRNPSFPQGLCTKNRVDGLDADVPKVTKPVGNRSYRRVHSVHCKSCSNQLQAGEKSTVLPFSGVKASTVYCN